MSYAKRRATGEKMGKVQIVVPISEEKKVLKEKEMKVLKLILLMRTRAVEEFLELLSELSEEEEYGGR